MILYIFLKKKKKKKTYQSESMSSREGQRERDKQTPCWEQGGTQAPSHDSEILTWAETKSWVLSHPGAPMSIIFISEYPFTGRVTSLTCFHYTERSDYQSNHCFL